MAWLELKVPPVVVVGLHAWAIWALSDRGPSATPVPPAVEIVAVGSIAVGIAIVIAALWQFHASRTTVDPHRPSAATAIVTTGVFGLSRNPIYMAFGLMLVGWALRLGSLVGLLLVPIYGLYMTRFQIRPEERALEERFGVEFRDYMSRVRRWI